MRLHLPSPSPEAIAIRLEERRCARRGPRPLNLPMTGPVIETADAALTAVREAHGREGLIRYLSRVAARLGPDDLADAKVVAHRIFRRVA